MLRRGPSHQPPAQHDAIQQASQDAVAGHGVLPALRAPRQRLHREELVCHHLLEKLTSDNRGGPAPSRFDPAYYRTHDAISYVPADAQSVVSQALTQSFPLAAHPFPGAGPGGRKSTYTGYASSVISQQPADGAGDHLTSGHALAPMSSRASSIAYSQFDRLPPGPALDKKPTGLGPRRLSIGSITPSDAVSSYGYKAGDDDTQSIAPSQAGMTEF